MTGDWWNGNVFSCCWKEETDGADCTSSGRVFQKREAATGNERRPAVDKRYCGKCSCSVNDDRIRRRPRRLDRTSWLRYGGISSLLHSVNLILFTPVPIHLILCISPHHSHYLYSHHLSLPQPFTPDLNLISFTNPFLHSLDSFRTAFTDLLTCTELSQHWRLFVLVSCARLSWSHLAFQSTLNCSITHKITIFAHCILIVDS